MRIVQNDTKVVAQHRKFLAQNKNDFTVMTAEEENEELPNFVPKFNFWQSLTDKKMKEFIKKMTTAKPLDCQKN